ncbi:MAG: FapA family protein [Burkholderiaceae bacterium]|nr:FapA family protein [Burkholderiaceae bacterium]
MDFPGISLSEADGQVFLHAQPAQGRPLVDTAALHALLAQAGYGEWLLHEDAIASAASDCNTQSSPFRLLVAQRCDAPLTLQMASDEMAATLSFTPPQGGKAATVDAVMQALAEAGVVFGIDEAAVRQACEAGGCNHLPVAHGVLSQNGCDTVFKEMVPLTVDRAPQLDENGLIDYREHGSITVVQSGAPLMRRIPATAGVAGQTIRGHVLAPHPGRDEPFAAQLAGVQLAPDDPNLLQAAVTGQPVRVKNGVMVEPILRVAEVNMETGNIHYDGTVHVDGEVVQGMKVQASGDIVVNGMVDGGLLEAGGNIQVTGGVIAHARLRAGGSVSARFAEGAHIYAGTVIVLDEMALECELQALNQIIIGAGSPQRGRLIGGSATAMMLVKVPLLGSAKSGVTKVLLGANPELDAKYAALQQRIETEKAAEDNLDKLVKQLTAAGDPKGLLERVKASRQHAIQVWGQSLAEQGELDQQLALAKTAKVEVGVGAAGAVDLSFGKLTARLRREFDAGTFCVDPAGHVVFTDPAGYAVPVA